MMKEISAEIISANAAGKSWSAVFSDLIKARLTTLVLLFGFQGEQIIAQPLVIEMCIRDSNNAAIVVRSWFMPARFSCAGRR